MMYLALTYDHRLLDGREAVTFLVKVSHLHMYLEPADAVRRSRITSRIRDACCWVKGKGALFAFAVVN
jgi:hypothetical protein